MNTVVQDPKNETKNRIFDLRRQGLSYSEIKKQIPVPKSTLSSWLKNINLTESQIQRLKKRRSETAKMNAEKKILKTSQLIEDVRKSSIKDIQKISKRELWLMGIMLYWRERFSAGSESDLRKGVRFTSSDSYLVKLFLRWLREVGNIQPEEMGFDIFIKEDKKNSINEIIRHWSQVTGFPKDYFSHIYFQKNIERKSKRKILKKSHVGFLRTRVKASTMLARQIAGWAKGIQQYYED